jgi:hypothetical protein
MEAILQFVGRLARAPCNLMFDVRMVERFGPNALAGAPSHRVDDNAIHL